MQGNELTVIIQAPTTRALSARIVSFKRFAKEEGCDTIKILERGPDPDGGYRAIITAHNFNPLTWVSEKYHRTKYGLTTGWSQGAEKARMKAEIQRKKDLEAEREIAEARSHAKAERKIQRAGFRRTY